MAVFLRCHTVITRHREVGTLVLKPILSFKVAVKNTCVAFPGNSTLFMVLETCLNKFRATIPKYFELMSVLLQGCFRKNKLSKLFVSILAMKRVTAPFFSFVELPVSHTLELFCEPL